jgi:hypothetical protein
MLKDKDEHDKSFVKRMNNLNNEYYDKKKENEELRKKLALKKANQSNITKQPVNNIDEIEKSTNIRDKIIDLIKCIESSIN